MECGVYIGCEISILDVHPTTILLLSKYYPLTTKTTKTTKLRKRKKEKR